jgi:hypothetical protein
MRNILAFLNKTIHKAEQLGDFTLANRLHNLFIKLSKKGPNGEETPEETPEPMNSGYRVDEHVGGKYTNPDYLSLSNMGESLVGTPDEEAFYTVVKMPPVDSEIYGAFDPNDENALHLGSKIDVDILLQHYDFFQKLYPYLEPNNGKVYAWDRYKGDWKNVPLTQVAFAQDDSGEWVPVFEPQEDISESEPMINAWGNPEQVQNDAIRAAGGHQVFNNTVKLVMDEVANVKDIDIILAIACHKISKSYTDEYNAVSDILMELARNGSLPWPANSFKNKEIVMDKIEESYNEYQRIKMGDME